MRCIELKCMQFHDNVYMSPSPQQDKRSHRYRDTPVTLFLHYHLSPTQTAPPTTDLISNIIT